MNEEEKLNYLENLINFLENSIQSFIKKIDRPSFLQEAGNERFRYLSPTPLHFQILKSVHIVSCLYSSLVLYKIGHIHEMAILFRSIGESISDIDFIQEAIEAEEPNEHQKRMLNSFFSRDTKPTEEIINSETKLPRVPRKKVRASLTRQASPFENPEKIRKIHEIIEDGFSAYVHAEYTTIMELYSGNINIEKEKFRMNGMLGTPKLKPFLWYLSSFIINGFSCGIIIARNLDLNELSESLLTKRKELEQSEVYQQKI